MSSRIRDWGYAPGQFPTGPKNSVLDVPGVLVGQVDIHEGEDVHTGVTVIFPRGIKNTIYTPCYAAVHDMNTAGEWTGIHQIREWGFTRAPIAFTNTVSIGKVYDSIWRWTMRQLAADGITGLDQFEYFGFPTVGETFDGLLNDISRSAVEEVHVLEAIKRAETQTDVLEGNHGGGTGMRSHGFKAGTGTSSRLLKGDNGKTYTLGVIVQNNYGSPGDLQIDGVKIGKILWSKPAAKIEVPKPPESGKVVEGSCLVLIITDVPMLPHQLKRMAQRAGMGLSQVSGHGVGRNFSGEFFMALSTGNSPESPSKWDGMSSLPPFLETDTVETVKSQLIDTLFMAAAEATEEAVLNAMTSAKTLKGFQGFETKALPREEVEALLKKYGRGYMDEILEANMAATTK
ncbi:peptidase S58 DmpA biosynthesis protein ArgJ [Coleophoma cylindrospora]|uniref:Peptidase S58 DmpA biosynthesis protein ArgJ n=1 Tax=Coleophoma cylindrospora TaxID=1849047 RepID=A0A3D8Q403_9HELO|nr:peptidase S58 DmpA biosynthesis protein ArgJ [Coleophoma cylindrospora]